MRSFMVPGTKTHFRLYNDVEFNIRFFMKRGPDHTFIPYLYGIEVLFPGSVPIFLLDLRIIKIDLEQGVFENGKLPYYFGIPILLFYIGLHPLFGLDKAFKLHLAQFGD